MTKILIKCPTLEWETWRAKSGVTVSSCDAVGLTVEVQGYETAAEVIKRTLDVWLFDLHEDGELLEWCNERGWGVEMTPGPKDEITFDIPWEIVRPKRA